MRDWLYLIPHQNYESRNGDTMNKHIQIDPKDFLTKPHFLFDRQWFLLTAGDFATNDFNCMTIGWGSIGKMWNKPYVIVVVRPTRYTYQFMEKYPDFTLCIFPETFKKDLAYLGSHSGRDEDKLSKTHLTAIKAQKVRSPSFVQAELSIECRKIYSADFDPSRFLDSDIEKNYPQKDYHRVYYGEIINILGASHYHQG